MSSVAQFSPNLLKCWLLKKSVRTCSRSDDSGQASGLKVIRSVFTKGFECILLECLHAARELSIGTAIKSSIIEFLERDPIESTMNMLITSNAIHARRRAGEMEGVVELLNEIGIDNVMTVATMKKLMWSADLGLRDLFNGEMPEHMEEVIKHMPKGTT